MKRAPPTAAYGRLEEVLLAIGLGLVLFGLVVMGLFETLAESAHGSGRVLGVSVERVHASVSSQRRSSVIALGFLVLSLLGFSRVGRAVIASFTTDS